MKKLFVNEWIKIKYSRMLWFLYGGILAFVLLLGASPSGTMRPLDNGFPASFGYMSLCVTTIIIFLSPMVGIFFTRELQQGTMHNTLSCGVDRGRYFMVKTICAIASGTGIHVISVFEFTILRIATGGFRPVSVQIPHCGFATALLFQLGCCVQQFTYIAFFLLISVLFRKTAIVNLAGIVTCFAEAMLSRSVSWYRGPIASVLASYDLWLEGKVLTMEFLRQYGQCAVMSMAFLALAYLIFRRRDIN